MKPSDVTRAFAALLLGWWSSACSDEPPPGARTANAPPSRATTDDAASSAPYESTAPAAIGIPDEARARGLDYVNRSGEPHKPTVLEANGAGVALLDLHGDGDLDLVFSQGLASLDELREGPGADLEVFHNDGRGRFTRAPGPGLDGWWTGLATGDVDNDGDADLVAGGFGALALLLQNESGELELAPKSDLMPSDPATRFTPGERRERGQPPLWVSSLALFDAERDGNLDLYVGHYLELDPLDPPIGRVGDGELAIPCRWKGLDVFCGPHGLVPQPARYLRGGGDGTFVDATRQAFPDMIATFTLAVVAFDADNDGDSDVYVANDSVANLLWINDGQGRFGDRALAAGVALSQDGAAQAGMGIAFGDVDRDGLFDFAVTNFSEQPTELFLGAKLGFRCETFKLGLARATKPLLSWGVHLVDFDADGWLDLFTANGHVYPQADQPQTGTSYAQASTMWRIFPGERVRAIEPEDERSLLAAKVGARGSACGDVDGDLAPDLVLARIDSPASLGVNRLGGDNHRLLVRCLGPARRDASATLRTPADGMGTRVIVVPKLPEGATADQEFALLGEVQTAQGYQSASSPWLHFGLGASSEYATIQVRWPSGRVDEIGPGRADRALTIREGEGVVAEVEKR